LFHTIGIVDVQETIGAHPGNERGLELSRQAIHVLQKGWQKFELSSAFWEILFGSYSPDSSSASPCLSRASQWVHVTARRLCNTFAGSTGSISKPAAASRLK